MKILMLSAYHADSHEYWCKGLMQQFPDIDWTLLSLPARYFNWRIRGNSLYWSTINQVELSQPYDLLIATSMTDLHGLIGFQPHLARIPSVLYFHENQFAYPLSENARDNVEPRLVPVYSAICATRICFNSYYNQQTFFSGLASLLKKLPDFVPKGIEQAIQLKSRILPVPLNTTSSDNNSVQRDEVFSIVWNHRWEYDKWPECFFEALRRLKLQGYQFKLHVLGQSFRQVPEIFLRAEQEFSEEIVNWGYINKQQQYLDVLQSAHVVVSTAIHDFQGIAVLEAVANGCLPVVPDRLAYQELFFEQFRYDSFPDDVSRQSEVLLEKLSELINAFHNGHLPKVPEVSSVTWSNLRGEYTSLFKELVESTHV